MQAEKWPLGPIPLWLLKTLSRAVPGEREGKEPDGNGPGENGCSGSGRKRENVCL